MFKFRSMHVDAEDKLKEIEHLRVGEFIQKTSIDELPWSAYYF